MSVAPGQEVELVELIEAVRSYPQLYDANEPDFKIPTRKDRAWLQIARKLQANLVDCRKKWRTLRERYTRELKKRHMEPDKRVSWEYFEEMCFLEPHVKLRSLSDSFSYAKPLVRTKVEPLEPSIWENVKDQRGTMIVISTDHEQHPQASENSIELDMVDGTEYETFEYVEDNPASVQEAKDSAEHTQMSTIKQSSSPEHQPLVVNKEVSFSTVLNEDQAFGHSIALTLGKFSRLNNIRAKSDIFKILQKYIELEEEAEAERGTR